MASEIRRAAVAGSWYPRGAAELRDALEGHLCRADSPGPGGRPVALLSPHAGLVYSGPVAACGYALLRGVRDVSVVLVGPSHRARFDGVSLWPRGAFETPLGPIPVDTELAQALLGHGGIADLPSPHVAEHSLEMQLPFLAHLVPGLRIVPLLMGRQDRTAVDPLAEALAQGVSGRDDVVLVASSDLSHYHPARVANALDAEVVARVRDFDAGGLMDLLEAEPDHACGGGPLVAVMKAARTLGAGRAGVLRYADSGDEAGRDKSRVVGYLSAALWAS